MGCCPGNRKSRNNPIKSIQRASIKTQEELTFQPKDFVMERKGKFEDYYELGKVLGKGAFGEVRRCIDRHSLQPRAVKIIKLKLMTQEALERFHAEIEILKSMDHPNIVRLYEYFQDDDCIFLVTELLKGGELFEQILKKRQFTEQETAPLIKQVLSAIVYCHSRNIVHRDLKPENLILDIHSPSAKVKVVDFGTAMIFDSKVKLTEKFGTPYYIAPEVLSKRYNEKCDVWSLGVIIYLLLSGYPPFNGRSDREVLRKVKLGRFSMPSNEWKGISPEVKDLIKQMLTLDPNKRMSAQEALSHSWFKQKAKDVISKNIGTLLLNKLKAFNTEEKLEHAVMTYLASQLSTREEKTNIEKLFNYLDRTMDGKLSRAELIHGYVTICQESEDSASLIVDNIFKQVDADGNGYIDYTEFVLGTLDRNILLSKENLLVAFKLFDLDNSGTIEAEEIKQILGLGKDIEEKVWGDIIRRFDANGTGSISFNEFSDMMNHCAENKTFDAEGTVDTPQLSGHNLRVPNGK